MVVKLLRGDCLELMKTLPDASVDLILCDLPYGTTQNKWDSIIPLDMLWAEYERICVGAIVLTAAQPFTSALVMSRPKLFRYEWVWQKEPSGPLNAKRRPMPAHESILLFAKTMPVYFPQGLRATLHKRSERSVSRTTNYGAQRVRPYVQTLTGYPSSLLPVAKDHNKVHPTQKPVALMEYLIRTYTSEGDTVLDNCMGSGTTGVACVNTGRKFVGIERDSKYFEIARSRIATAQYGFG